MKLRVFFLVLSLFLISQHVIFASSYILPYPSSMPGGISYKIHKVIEFIEKYWYFGSINQYKYYVKYSDRYLVEAKTLLEYQQYLLATNALQKSDSYFSRLKSQIRIIENEKKDVSQIQQQFSEQKQKHIEILEKLKKELPETITWEEEKKKPVQINFSQIISKSISIRNN